MANFILLFILKAVVGTGTMYRIRPRIQYLNI